MRQISNIVDVMDYLERREKLVDRKLLYWSSKHKENPSQETLLQVGAAMGAAKETKTFMLRLLGRKYSELGSII